MLRAGGGPNKAALRRDQALAGRKHAPATICEWNERRRQPTNDKLGAEENRLVGGSKSQKTIKTYVSCFKHWARYRELLDKAIMIRENERLVNDENDVCAFARYNSPPPVGKKQPRPIFTYAPWGTYANYSYDTTISSK